LSQKVDENSDRTKENTDQELKGKMTAIRNSYENGCKYE